MVLEHYTRNGFVPEFDRRKPPASIVEDDFLYVDQTKEKISRYIHQERKSVAHTKAGLDIIATLILDRQMQVGPSRKELYRIMDEMLEYGEFREHSNDSAQVRIERSKKKVERWFKDMDILIPTAENEWRQLATSIRETIGQVVTWSGFFRDNSG